MSKLIQVSDEEIIRMLRSDSERNRGFVQLTAQYGAQLYRHIARIAPSSADTEDILQNVMIKVLQHIRQFEGRARFYTWLYRIATHEALNFVQKKREVHGLSVQTSLEQARADMWWDADAVQRCVEEAIRLLPEKQRVVFTLRYFEEMPYEDMSYMLDTSVGALKASFHHALKKVENHLREHHPQIL